ncbi:hypothetical protein FGG08_000641 [Glutinoglossum americanum]|uniref:Protein kinase domain-containing protein n=1 Tax=Glutinoglossum americanum TaxID=1670608 RepID=A0A9P8I9Z8_9PEZI|nr:hypothetical protein FGG08_000641 [Glutinoglossum americanum]
MLQRKRPRLISVPEEEESSAHLPKEYSSISWEDFDHSQTLLLGHSGLTRIVYEQETFRPHIFQSCQKNITKERFLLAEIARDSDLFIPTHFIFSYRDNICVGSKVAGICLADVIDCTIPLTEGHASSILQKVVRALAKAADRGIKYGHVKASNVFLSLAYGPSDIHPDLLIQLANFGPRLEPQEFKEGHPNSDCQDIGHFAYHLVTRISKIPNIQTAHISEQKMLKLGSSGYAIDINAGFTTNFVDFLETCMSTGDLKRLIRVS